MKKTLKALKNKLLELSSMFFIMIIVCSILFIPLSLSSLFKSITMDNLVDNSDSSVVAFDHYFITRNVTNNSVLRIVLYLENGESVEIDSIDYSKELEAALSELKTGEDVRLILDPETGFVIYLASDYLIYQADDGIFSAPIATLLLILSIFLICFSATFLVLQNIEKKKLTAFIDEKAAEFNNYSYKIETILEKTCWVIVVCNEVDARDDAEVFANLLKRISTKVNKGYWEGCFSLIGEHRYKIKNDPLSLTYQYDTLLGIVIEYKKGTPMNILLDFLHNTAQIQTGVK